MLSAKGYYEQNGSKQEMILDYFFIEDSYIKGKGKDNNGNYFIYGEVGLDNVRFNFKK